MDFRRGGERAGGLLCRTPGQHLGTGSPSGPRATITTITVPPQGRLPARSRPGEGGRNGRPARRGAATKPPSGSWGRRLRSPVRAKGYETNVPATVENVNRAVENMTGEAEISGETLAAQGHHPGSGEGGGEKAPRGSCLETWFSRPEGQSWTISPTDVGYALEVARRDGEMQVSLDPRPAQRAYGSRLRRPDGRARGSQLRRKRRPGNGQSPDRRARASGRKSC